MSYQIDNSIFLPTPKETFDNLFRMVENGMIWKHIGASFLRITGGVIIATLFSIPMGMIISWVDVIYRWMYPFVVVASFIPVTVFNVLLVLYLGTGELMKVTFIAIAVTFTMWPNVVEICETPNPKLEDTAYTMGFSYPRMLFFAKIPYIMPSLINLIINSYSVGWTFVILAELTNTQHGLGHLMYIGKARANTALVYTALVTLVGISFVFTKVCQLLLGKTFDWWKGDKKHG